MLALLLSLLLASPFGAAQLVAADEDEAALLTAIAHRESRGLRIRRHKVDERPRGWIGDGNLAARWVGSRAWAKAVQVGDLEPASCPWHDRGDPRDWSTRGAYGHVAAFALQYLPVCAPPWVLDVPLISAWVAVQRLRVARGRRAPRALRRWAGLGPIAKPGSRRSGPGSGLTPPHLRSP